MLAFELDVDASLRSLLPEVLRHLFKSSETDVDSFTFHVQPCASLPDVKGFTVVRLGEMWGAMTTCRLLTSWLVFLSRHHNSLDSYWLDCHYVCFGRSWPPQWTFNLNINLLGSSLRAWLYCPEESCCCQVSTKMLLIFLNLFPEKRKSKCKLMFVFYKFDKFLSPMTFHLITGRLS